MAIRYYNIKEKPDMNGFAVKVDTEKYMKKSLESFSSENHSFEKTREDERYAHFNIIEGDYIVMRDKTADSKTIGANPITLKNGKGLVANACIDDSGNIKLYNKKKKNLFIQEISKSKAYSLRRNNQNWRRSQSKV